jgi:hypothetical protein
VRRSPRRRRAERGQNPPYRPGHVPGWCARGGDVPRDHTACGVPRPWPRRTRPRSVWGALSRRDPARGALGSGGTDRACGIRTTVWGACDRVGQSWPRGIHHTGGHGLSAVGTASGLSCCEAHAGKSGTLLHVVTHVAPSVPRGANHRKQARAARRREPPADARLCHTPPPPDLRCRVPCRNRSRPLAHLRRAVSSSPCHRALCMV